MLINPGDVADQILANALWAVGQMIMRPHASRRTTAYLTIASWFETEKLTANGLPGARLELPGLSKAEAAELKAALNHDEVQGALQALLAARLTDAPETDAARAREAVRLALAGAATPTAVSARYAAQLTDYYDRKVSDLVGHLERRVGPSGLSQIRSEAFNSRIVALLGTITDLLAALADPGRAAMGGGATRPLHGGDPRRGRPQRAAEDPRGIRTGRLARRSAGDARSPERLDAFFSEYPIYLCDRPLPGFSVCKVGPSGRETPGL